MRTLLVVGVGELVEQGLELRDGAGLVGLGTQPVLEGLVEAFFPQVCGWFGEEFF